MLKKLKSLISSFFRWLKRHWKLVLILALLITGGLVWYVRKQQSQVPDLTFIKPTQETLVQTLEVSGVVDAKEKANLRFIAGGKVTYVGAKQGDWIKKGQTLATIDQRQLEKQLQQDLNAYLQQRNAWDQTLDDTKDRALPKSEVRTKENEHLH